MPDILLTYITNMDAKFDSCEDWLGNMATDFSMLGHYIGLNDWATAKLYCNDLATQCGWFRDDLATSIFSVRFWLKLALNYIDSNASFDGVTWQTIVEAWAKDDFEGRTVTIAFIDRMRQLIWDEPFSVLWAAEIEKQELPD